MLDFVPPILPPLVVLLIGLITHRIRVALATGIMTACLLVNGINVKNNIHLISNVFMGNTLNNKMNMYIFSFLICLGIVVKLLQKSGGALAYQRLAMKRVKSQRGVEISSMLLSAGLMIDDYLSCLTVGTVIKPLCNWFRVSRLKLAYLTDSLSAPLTILCPVSSWVAAIIGFFRENGISLAKNSVIHANPFHAYLSTLPFMFYSFLTIITVILISWRRISYGFMSHAELEALHEQTEIVNAENLDRISVWDFFGPIIVLLSTVIITCLITGGWSPLESKVTLSQALIAAKIPMGLLFGGIVSLCFSTIWFLNRNLISFKDTLITWKEGIELMYPAVLMLILAWSMGDLLRDHLNTGQVLADLLKNFVNINFLPAIFFILASLIAFSLGTAWGTSAILFPIAIDLVISLTNTQVPTNIANIPILMPVLGALLSGAIAGDHISPISDLAIMASTSTDVNLIQHLKTQIPYTIPVIVCSTLCFTATPFLIPYGILTATVVPIMIAILAIWIFLAVANKEIGLN